MKQITENQICTNREILQEIWSQLVTLGKIKMWSWGVCGIKSVAQTQNPFLQFKVNGRHFKGHVRVEYHFNDTYTIKFGRFGRRYESMFKTIKEYSDVYFDQMVGVIDDYVEYIPSYGAN